MKPLICFRVDASDEIGTGHVMRCLVLASEFAAAGARTVFLCRNHRGNLAETIEKRGFEVHLLSGAEANGKLPLFPPHEAWLGVDWLQDAEETLGWLKLCQQVPEWLIIDHYAIDEQWQRQVRKGVKRIMVIDDLADRSHDCDVLLDQNSLHNMEQRYNDKVSDSCLTLLGAQFALIDPIYADYHRKARRRRKAIEHVLVYFGGSDEFEMTYHVINSLIQGREENLHIDVVIGKNYHATDRLFQMIGNSASIRVHREVPGLAELMMKADLAIGACGVTAWERLCLGLPALVITLAENQKEMASYLAECGLIEWLGDAADIDLAYLKDRLFDYIERGCDPEQSTRCMEMVDGMGVYRVMAALQLDAQSPLFVREVEENDERLILEWANEKETRKNGFVQHLIGLEEHHIWFADKLSDNDNCSFFIFENNQGVPVGQTRFQQLEEGVFEVNYSIDKIFRGRGLGKKMLRTAIETFAQKFPGVALKARVRGFNRASRRIFVSLGFTESSLSGSEDYSYLYNINEQI